MPPIPICEKARHRVITHKEERKGVFVPCLLTYEIALLLHDRACLAPALGSPVHVLCCRPYCSIGKTLTEAPNLSASKYEKKASSEVRRSGQLIFKSTLRSPRHKRTHGCHCGKQHLCSRQRLKSYRKGPVRAGLPHALSLLPTQRHFSGSPLDNVDPS